MLRKVRRYGYTEQPDIWYDIGGVSGARPATGKLSFFLEEATPRWQIRKVCHHGWYYLDMTIDNDGGPQYAIFTLQYVHNCSDSMLKSKNFRGAYPRFKIEDIIEEQIHLLPTYQEILLAQASTTIKIARRDKLCTT